MSCAFKWLGKKAFVLSLPDYKNYRKDLTNDEQLVRAIYKYIDEADIILAHNGRKFDLRKINAKFFKYGLPPPSPYQTIDTLLSSRQNFDFASHRLNEIAKLRKLGEKVHHEGWPLWKACMAGDMKAWAKMCRYNIHDVELLEKIYNDLRPWIKNHPAFVSEKPEPAALFNGKCLRCGKTKFQSRGLMISGNKIYQRFQCKNCGGWMKQLKKATTA